MALVNIHPDYVDFSGTSRARNEYPVAWVREFLKHLFREVLSNILESLCQRTRGMVRRRLPPRIQGFASTK